jgi:uncharacterized repeat protein (TIGR03847 family)
MNSVTQGEAIPIIRLMESAEHDFGRALSINAEAVGRPGQRRFRLIVRSTSNSMSVWMEKQQLAGIGTWFEEVIERLNREHPTDEPDVEPTGLNEPALEIRASQIGLGYDEGENAFTLHAFDADNPDPRQSPAFRCQITRGQARVLARKIATVVAAGRQMCPLCNAPMDPEGHVCPRANGHHAAAVG